MTDIRKYAPEFLLQITELDAVFSAINAELETVEQKAEAAFGNSFAATADDDGIRRIAASLGLPVSGDAEKLRHTVNCTLKERRPYTWRNLKAFLDGLIGVGEYDITRGFNDQMNRDCVHLTVCGRSEAEIAGIRKKIEAMMPVNMGLIITNTQPNA